jgi:hypothetical protein
LQNASLDAGRGREFGKLKMPPYCNWLEKHDEAALGLPPAVNFTEYSFFHLARYPRLRPHPPDDTHQRRIYEITQKSYATQIALKRSSLPGRATDGLTSDQIDQLAALIIDLGGDLDDLATHGTEANQLRQIGRDGAQKQKKLTKQVEKIRLALAKLEDLADQVPPLLGRRYKVGAQACLDCLDVYCTPIPDETLREQLSIHQPQDDPTSFAVVPLYWFFRHECGQSGNESEVRAAMLRNQFLTPPGREPLKVEAEFTGGESGGSSAVRIAVRRYSREAQGPQKTPKK